MTSALIVYASFTGNTEEAAHTLEKELKKLEVQVRIEECTQVDPSEFLAYDICVVATYTWGRNAELPDEIVDFYEKLGQLDLTGKVYGTLGSGDTFYDKFCKSVDDFDQQFQHTKAVRGSEGVKVDAYVKKEDIANITAFAKNLVAAYKNRK